MRKAPTKFSAPNTGFGAKKEKQDPPVIGKKVSAEYHSTDHKKHLVIGEIIKITPTKDFMIVECRGEKEKGADDCDFSLWYDICTQTYDDICIPRLHAEVKVKYL